MFKTIITGTDGSPAADKAVRYAIGLAEPYAARIVIARATPIVDPAVMFGDPKQDKAKAELEDYAAKLGAEFPNANLDWRWAKGDPSDVLCDLASEEHADIIVVGNRGMQGAKRFFLGSVPNRVAHQAPCAVLIVDTMGNGAAEE